MKTANRNLLMFLIPSVVVLLLGVLLLTQGESIIESAKALWPDTPQGEAGDVEGYAMIAGMIGTGLGGLAGLAVQLAGMLAIVYAGALLVLSAAARLVYGKTPGRVLAYRIVMGLDFFVLMLPFPDILKSFVQSLADGSFLPLCLVYIVVSLIMLVTGCRRTYTSQVLR